MISRTAVDYVSDPDVDVKALLEEMKYNNNRRIHLKIQPNVNKCLISHEPLTYNYICLPCTHTFNYIPLYTELCMHIQPDKLSIKCPYCRILHNKLIPYIPIPSVKHVIGVNAPADACIPPPICPVILSRGNNKGQGCNKPAVETSDGIFCLRHHHR